MATWGDYSLRKMIKNIVGANWDGSTISDIMEIRPIPKFITQPQNTDGTGSSSVVNMYGGFFARLEIKVDDSWNPSTVVYPNSDVINMPLSSVINTRTCRIVVVYGGKAPLYSNEFTVTRTAVQTQALKQNLESGKLDSEVFETDVENPVVEKTTTTKSK